MPTLDTTPVRSNSISLSNGLVTAVVEAVVQLSSGELYAATEGFDASREVGEGGFAKGWEAEAQRLRSMAHFDAEGYLVC